MSRLYIGQYEIELGKSNIAQTKQTNDLTSLNTRQANYTNRFKVPLTANNKKAFNMLGVTGNTSLTPYIKTETSLYSDSGECFIYKGFCIIKSTGKEYNINVYDGNIDLYKAIENLNLSSLDLSSIAHTKNLTNVTNSFDDSNNLDYKYIVADYNGKALYDTNKINIDYLVPSVNVEYLWNKIFDTFGFTYSGSVFNTFEFSNLWMTYPKGILSTVPDVDVYDSDDMLFPQNGNIHDNVPNEKNSLYLTEVTNTTNDLVQIFEDKHFKVAESSNYRIQTSGTIKPRGKIINFDGSTSLAPTQCDLWIGKNSEGLESDDVTLIKLVKANIASDSNNNADSIDGNIVIDLQSNDSLCLVLVRSGNPYRNLLYCAEQTDLTLTISKVDNEEVDFSDAFINFKIKDFFNEVLFRFGLTPFKDKYTSNYNFLTMQELIQSETVVDWSASNDKFSEKISESYIYGSYAQQNVFKHKYNDSNDDYYDGSINIDNENLNDSKNAIVSKIYVPEKTPTNVFEKTTNKYKLWDKEPKDDGSTDYKSLSKRFYFLRYEDYYFNSAVTIGSEQLVNETTIYSAPFESFFGLSYQTAIQDYYTPLSRILNKSKIIKAKVFLNETDVSKIRFDVLYYIKELGGYFLLNKISNFIEKGATNVELISVEYTYTPQIANNDTILSIIRLKPVPPNDRFLVIYDDSRFIDANIEYVVNNGTPVSVPNDGTFVLEILPNSPKLVYSIYLQDSNFTSETKTFEV